MLTWVYEIHWTPFHIGFLLIFFTVFVVVVSTIIVAMRRTQQAEKSHTSDAIMWHSDFADLPLAMRVCRHELNGDVKHRTCDHEFDCRTCTVHPLLSAAQTKTPMLQFEVCGFTMPPYRMYHRGHTWVQQENDGSFTIGIDDFGARLIGKHYTMELPLVGSQLTVNGKGLMVKKDDANIRILSPIEGKVIEHGNEEKGWLLKVQATHSEKVTEHLLKGSEVPNWIMREMERLQFSLATKGVGVTLADGGVLVPDFQKYYPKTDWDGVLGQMFLEA
jgi:glycine cleavage system H lipoate-binding protein